MGSKESGRRPESQEGVLEEATQSRLALAEACPGLEGSRMCCARLRVGVPGWASRAPRRSPGPGLGTAAGPEEGPAGRLGGSCGGGQGRGGSGGGSAHRAPSGGARPPPPARAGSQSQLPAALRCPRPRAASRRVSARLPCA